VVLYGYLTLHLTDLSKKGFLQSVKKDETASAAALILSGNVRVQAAIRAGYSAKTVHPIGIENLRKPEIAVQRTGFKMSNCCDDTTNDPGQVV